MRRRAGFKSRSDMSEAVGKVGALPFPVGVVICPVWRRVGTGEPEAFKPLNVCEDLRHDGFVMEREVGEADRKVARPAQS